MLFFTCSANAQSDSLSGNGNLMEELKKEALQNRSFFEQFVGPETFDKVLESLQDIDLNDLQEQLDGLNIEELFESFDGEIFSSPLFKNFSLKNLNLNDLLNSEYFNLSPIPSKEKDTEEDKIKI